MASTRSSRRGVRASVVVLGFAVVCVLAVLAAWLRAAGPQVPKPRDVPPYEVGLKADEGHGEGPNEVPNDVNSHDVASGAEKSQEPAPNGAASGEDDVSDAESAMGAESAGTPQDVTGVARRGHVVEDSLSALASDEGTEVSEERVREALPVAAEEVLAQYRANGTCLLMQAGYLDLLGNVWGCVTEGPGWVDVCVVEEVQDEMCVVRSVRLESKEGEMENVV